MSDSDRPGAPDDPAPNPNDHQEPAPADRERLDREERARFEDDAMREQDS